MAKSAINTLQQIKNTVGPLFAWNKLFGITHDTENTMKAVGRTSGLATAGCACHLLQLCIRDATTVPVVIGVLEKSRRLEDYFRNSPSAQRELEAQQVTAVRILQENVTRWDSEFVAISRLYEQKDAIINVTSVLIAENLPVPPFGEEDWNVVAQLLLVLQLVRDVSLRLQSRCVTYSDVVVMLLTLRDSHLAHNEFDLEWLQAFKSILRTKISERFDSYFLSSKSLGAKSCSVDHRYKGLTFLSGSEVTAVRTWLLEEMRLHVASSISQQEVLTPPAQAVSSPLINASFLSRPPQVSTASPYETELDDFLGFFPMGNNEMDPLVFWFQFERRFPNLTKVAIQYLSLQPTSAESERTFSIAERAANGWHSRLCLPLFTPIIFR